MTQWVCVQDTYHKRQMVDLSARFVSCIGIATIMRIVKCKSHVVDLYDCTNGWASFNYHLGDGNSRLDSAINRVMRNSVLARCRRENFDIWGSVSNL